MLHISSGTASILFQLLRLILAADSDNAITNCPSTVGSYISPSGAKYQICAGTDLRGRTAQVLNDVPNQMACAQKCGTTNGCTKAVWDNEIKTCNIKDMAVDASMTWATDKRFDVIQVIETYDPAKQGSWTDFIRLPVVPVAAYIVPDYPEPSRLLVFSAFSADTFGESRGYTQFADYNFKTGAISERNITNTQHDMFCPGISALEDGRIVITGGSNANVTSIYDPSTNAFTRGPDMKIPRGYQSSATLSNGQIFTIGGSWSPPAIQKNGEIYDPKASTWTLLPGADVTPMLTKDREPSKRDNHAWLFAWKNGFVFQAGPSAKQHWYGTSGQGSVQEAGIRPDAEDQMCGFNVMFEPGKILSAGGSQHYTNSDATRMAHITTIGEPNTPSQIQRVPDMTYSRGFSNGVVLPNGHVLVVGGQKRSITFTDTDGIMIPEIFDPGSQVWTQMAPIAVPRNYHSEAILLPDARIWSGGGGLCFIGKTKTCDRTTNHPNGQIFSPPYLFTGATRPVIDSISTTTPKVGDTITVTMNAPDDATFAFLRIGTATHSTDTDQRRIPVTSEKSEKEYKIVLPSDSGIMIPGSYYLFALSKEGVPSVAKTVRVVL